MATSNGNEYHAFLKQHYSDHSHAVFVALLVVLCCGLFIAVAIVRICYKKMKKERVDLPTIAYSSIDELQLEMQPLLNSKSTVQTSLMSVETSSQHFCYTSIAFIWQCSKPFTFLWILSVNWCLVFYVYWTHKIYVILSISFILIPLLLSSLFISYTSYQSIISQFDNDRITHFSGGRRKCLEILLLIPFINIILTLSYPSAILLKNRVDYTLTWQSMFILMLLTFLIFPQFILNICFILSYHTISLFNWLHIITSVISLTFLSLLHYTYIYALDSLGEQIALLNVIKLRSFWIKFKYQLKIIFYVYFVIIILELIQFLPMLFEYFYYDNIRYHSMVTGLIIFNGTKIICFSRYIYSITIFEGGNCCYNFIRFILLMIAFIPFCLLVFMTITYKSFFENETCNAFKCEYFVLIMYLLINYIGCNIWLIIISNSLGLITEIIVYIAFGFVLIAMFIYSPFVLKKVLNKG